MPLWRRLWCWGVLTCVLGLGGCAQFHPFQPQGTALVRLGSYDNAENAKGGDAWIPSDRVAGYFVPYALMATRVYGDVTDGGERWKALRETTLPDGRLLGSEVDAWLAPWRKVTPDFHVTGPLKCEDPQRLAEGGCRGAIGGLAYELWARRDCSEVVVAFRGTDFREVNDWVTNFHWVVRFLPIYDQYEQVQDQALKIARRMKEVCPGRHPVLTAVGHSLGGGLAQQLAYKTNLIRRVYAFDPSFVTGYYDRHVDPKPAGLVIDRVYEHGEVLSYPRFLLRQLAPATPCNPQITTIRFNNMKGSAIFQHGMGDMTAKLIEYAGQPTEWRQRASKFRLPSGAETDPQRCGAGEAVVATASP